MSPNLDSPVQTQAAVSALNYGGGYKSNGTPVGRRRVFVQTETGCVLGMDLDRGDNAHTVKRRLQVALNFSTEESSLTFGDLELKNDLSAIRKDSPLLLTRSFLHRSSSTPCISDSASKEIRQKDQSSLIEVLGCSSHCFDMKQLVEDVVEAIRSGVDPVPVHSGLGGAYYFRNHRGESVAIVKPTDEEPFAPNNPKGFVGKTLGQPGLKKSVRVGETGFREVAAYLLDYNHFANVPPTVLVKITHSVFNVNDGVSNNSSVKVHEQKQQVSKIASFQQYIPHDYDASDHGTSRFPVAAVHRIGILDVRIFNTDRHAGNLLVRRLEAVAGRFEGLIELIPIDHGLCLPESLDDPYFEWIHWPQASIPFSDDELEYIANLDPLRDSDMLRMELPMIHEACLRVLVLCTIFLKEAAAFGLCLAEIGQMMSREFRGREEEPSELELVCIEARRLIAEREEFSPVELEDTDEFQFEIDCEEEASLSYHHGFKGGSSSNSLEKLEESREEEEEEDDTEESYAEKITCFPHEHLRNVSKMSASLKGVTLTGESQLYKAGVQKMAMGNFNKDNAYGGGGLESRSADEQLPTSVSFVKLADMGEEGWTRFLDKFQELLHAAFSDRKFSAATQRQQQRLGTSCQF